MRSENPVQEFWKQKFAFEYWDNRIEKISTYNSQDKLEALFILLQLSDLYVHSFAAQVRNPDQAWFLLKEETYGHHIKHVLSELESGEEGYVTVGKMLEGIDGFVSFEKQIDVDVSDREILARDFFGCPTVFDEENLELEFLDDPDLYLGSVNAVLNFWRGNKALLNDYKHGFRLLPVDSADFRHLSEEGFFRDQKDLAEDLATRIEDRNTKRWGFHFMRMDSEKIEEQHYRVFLNVYDVNSSACLTLAKIVLRLLNNLIQKQRRFSISEETEHLATVAEGDFLHGLTLLEKIEGMEVFYNPDYSEES